MFNNYNVIECLIFINKIFKIILKINNYIIYRIFFIIINIKYNLIISQKFFKLFNIITSNTM